MSLIKKALEEAYKESFDSVDDVEELVLDQLVPTKELQAPDKTFLARFDSLKFFSMASLGLESLSNFPALPALLIVQP